MTTKSKGKAGAKPNTANTLNISPEPGVSPARQIADLGFDPVAGSVATARVFNKGTFGEIDLTEAFDTLKAKVAKVEAGDLSGQRAVLAAQVVTLDAIFCEMARRAGQNMGEYINAAERYMRLALKAQAQSRATIEALDRLTNGHEQTVRHVHVDNRGGQAIITDKVTTGGQENGKADGQPHTTGTASTSPALLGADPFGQRVPIPSREGQEALQDARRD